MEITIECPNWELLREQKNSLLLMIQDLECAKIKDKERIEHLEGILGWIDNIQDAAVDRWGLDAKLVFGKFYVEEISRRLG